MLLALVFDGGAKTDGRPSATAPSYPAVTGQLGRSSSTAQAPRPVQNPKTEPEHSMGKKGRGKGKK